MGLFLAILMIALVGCSSSPAKEASAPAATPSNAAPAAAPAAPANNKPIKIGMMIPMTGEAVESGKFQKQGAQLAVDEVNAAGGVKGRQLQLVIEDDQTTNPGAVAALQKLLQDKEIPVIISSIRSTQVQAMLPTINDAKIPVAIGGTNYGLTHSGSQWVFRFRPHDGMSAKVMVKFIVEELKKSKIAVVHASDAFGNGGRDMVVDALKAYNLKIVSDQAFNNGEKDYTGIISALKQSGADVMISYITMSTDLGILAKQMKQQGLNITWVGSPSITGQDGIKLAGDSLNGTYGIADYNADGSAKSKAYYNAYKAKYNQEPDQYSSWSYDAVLVFAEAMKKAPDLKPDSIRNAILAIKGFEGAEGQYNFDQNGDGLDHYHIVQNNNNQFKLFKTIHADRG